MQETKLLPLKNEVMQDYETNHISYFVLICICDALSYAKCWAGNREGFGVYLSSQSNQALAYKGG
jgi:hypothetical protein